MKLNIQYLELLKKITHAFCGNKYCFIFFWFIFYRFSSKKIFVVNYHNTYGKFKKNFKWQINFFKQYFIIINYNDFNKSYAHKKKSKKPLLLITFDDGHKSNYEIAEQILKHENIKAIFFIPFNFINYSWPINLKKQTEISTKKFNIPCNINYEIQDKRKNIAMSWENIIKLHNDGHLIGCHGMNHERLSSKLTNKQLYDEIFSSKQLLEKKLNTKIETFCWIGGERWAYCSSAHKIIKKAKYKYSFTTCAQPYNPLKDDKLKIHRFNIETSFSKNQIRATFSFFYSLLYSLKRSHVNKMLDK